MIPRRLFWGLDFLVMAAAFLASFVVAPGVALLLLGVLPDSVLAWLGANNDWTGALPNFTELMWFYVLLGPLTALLLSTLGCHRALLEQSYTRIIVGSVAAVLLALSLVILGLFAIQNTNWSRVFIFTYTGLAIAALISSRIVMKLYVERRQANGAYGKNAVIIGPEGWIRWMMLFFDENVLPSRLRIYGYLQVPDEPPAAVDSRYPNLGSAAALGDLLVSRPIHEVLVVLPATAGSWVKEVIEACDYLGVTLRIIPEALLLGERRTLRMLFPFEALNLPAVVLRQPHHDSEALFLKRVMDIVLSAVLLVLLAPVIGTIALLIKLTTPGLPVLYPWRVVGQNGVEFTGYKFTTMVGDADQRKKDLEHLNEMQGPVFKIKQDPRVTPVGKVLRKFSLNELPQLWSVLKGDMSLVGPRPAFRSELERYEFWHKRKLSIKPGMTCLWQVRGRNSISSFDDWVRMDLEYIDNWSLWLDCKTLFRTAWAVIAGTGS